MFSNLFDFILVEREVVTQKDKKRLVKLTTNFREELEQLLGWKTNKQVFNGQCFCFVQELLKYFKDEGIKNARAVRGTYKDVDKGFIPSDLDVSLKNFDASVSGWVHWWVVVDNKWIVDITADQFHPGKEKDYRVIVTSVTDPNYIEEDE